MIWGSSSEASEVSHGNRTVLCPFVSTQQHMWKLIFTELAGVKPVVQTDTNMILESSLIQ